MTGELSRDIPDDIGASLYALARKLFPINRSLTGPGVRESLALIDEIVPLEIHEIPTGTQVFDWTIPREWTLREAYIEDEHGRRIIDARDNNLHVVGYSVPVDAEMTLEELRPHLHTLPEHPDWIPYRTSYYKESWGFCLSHRQLENLRGGRYRVRIDATLAPGALTLGEAVVPGETDDAILLSAHICHPSLCNDNLSGIALAAYLGRALSARKPRYTYRIVFAPGTIGAIAWLATHEDDVRRIRHGLVLALLGRPGPFTYKRTRSGTAPIDRVVEYVLRGRGAIDEIIAFSPWGYDERQYNSPGFKLDVGRLTRAPEGAYPEYHTSADDLTLVTESALAESYEVLCRIIDIIERDACYLNLRPHGEPQLGKYGLYNMLGGASSPDAGRLALLWTLNLSDGDHSLLQIAQTSGLAFEDIHLAATRLEEAGLLRRTSEQR